MKTIDLTKAKKLNTRIIARGEISDHAHIITGDAELYEYEDEVYIEVKGNACIKHLIESAFIQGNEVWTKEHKDIDLKKGTYKYIPQIEYDPYEEIIQQVKD